MSIEEAIQHCRERAAAKEGECPKCAAEHSQLADWLTELVAYKATGFDPTGFDTACREMSNLRVAAGLKTYEDLRSLIQDGRLLVLPQDNGKEFALCAICHMDSEFYNVDVKSVGDQKELPSLHSYLVHIMAESLGVGYHDLLRAMLKEPSVIDAAAEGGDEG